MRPRRRRPSGSGGLSEPQSSRLTSVIGASTRSSSSSSSSKSDSSLSGGDALPRSALAARAGDLGMAGRVSLLGDRELRGRPPRDLAVAAGARDSCPAPVVAREWSRLLNALQRRALDSRASSATALSPWFRHPCRSNHRLCSKEEHPRHQVSPSCASPCLHLLHRGGIPTLDAQLLSLKQQHHRNSNHLFPTVASTARESAGSRFSVLDRRLSKPFALIPQ